MMIRRFIHVLLEGLCQCDVDVQGGALRKVRWGDGR